MDPREVARRTLRLQGSAAAAALAWHRWPVPARAFPGRPGEAVLPWLDSRATDTQGQVQPAPDDPWLATKRTFWESTGQVTRRVLVGAPRG